MTHAFRQVSIAVLILAFASGQAPRPAAADDTIAKVKKVTARSSDPKEVKEVPYPTPLAQLVTDRSQEDVKKDTAVKPGQALLTRSANTHLKMHKDLEALLYSDTFVRFDGLNIWLLRHGQAYVVAKRGGLEIVAEALGRILVNSKVYIRTDGTRLLAFVTEGHVVLEANARTLSLGPGKAGRLVSGEGPQEATLTPEEQAEIEKDLETAERVMKGGGSASGVAVAAAVAALIAGAAIASSGGGGGSGGSGGSGGTGGSGGSGTGGGKGLPDLVPDDSRGGCRFDDKGNMLLTVRNQGQADAPGSITRVEFDQNPRTARGAGVPGAQDLKTPALRAGAASPVALGSRQVQGLQPRVTVDAAGRVRESNEGNNTAVITCPARPAQIK